MTRIALCQVNSADRPEENLRLVAEHVTRAAADGAKVVVFPEAMMARFGVPLAPLAEPLDGHWASSVAEIATQHGVVIVAGMFTPADAGRVHNTVLVTGDGLHLAYDKVHLYDAFGFRESDRVAPGSAPVTFGLDGVRFGLATCYDVRFPRLFEALADAGASVVLVPASWGAGDGKRAQWELLVRARALDTGCWVLGCGQADPAVAGLSVHPKAPTGIGCSLVADPFGRVDSALGPAPGVLTVDVDADAVVAARESTGVLRNRR